MIIQGLASSGTVLVLALVLGTVVLRRRNLTA
jgi:hypothetical protein